MVSLETIAGIAIKVLKLVINLIILILYRTGYQGEFLGVGGTWNLNEDKNPDAEIVASGVLVGFFIYTSVVLITYCFGNSSHKKTLVEIIMNFVGTFMFIAIGGTALHYWHGYQSENKYDTIVQERQVGLAVGSLCVIEGAAYLVDLILSVLHFAKSHDEYLE
ncbi:protein snakeskin [Bombus flavifrons]|uniref:protein snakeskin n=1 Tax=Bombus flavifrons TaxID=103934 RepID=UPI003703F443